VHDTAPPPPAVTSRRRPSTHTVAFAALALAAVVLFSVLVPVLIALYAQPPAFAFLFGALLCAAPVVAVRYPRWATAIFVGSAAALPLPALITAGTVWPWPWSVPAMIVFILLVGVLAVLHGWRIAIVAWLLGIVVTLAVVIVLAPTVPVAAGIVNLVIVTSISGAALLVAVLLASRLRIGAELTRERELTALEQSRRVLIEERARIARELHDVVAHGMSLIQVQASTARYRVPGLSAETLHEFDEIAQTARTGLTEMRRLLGVLRTDDHEADLAPQQGVRDIGDLVEAMRRAGADIHAQLLTRSDDVPATVDVTAFRIVQESLSNAARHAPQAPVTLVVERDGDALRLRIRNAASSSPTAAPTASRGHGLLGMRERAALVGGTVSAGPDSDGGWTVQAVLPLVPDGPDAPPVTGPDSRGAAA
jgi:signal transduction histidine kinase